MVRPAIANSASWRRFAAESTPSSAAWTHPTQTWCAFAGKRSSKTRRDIYEAKTEIEEIESQIQKGTAEDLRGLRLDYEQVIREIGALEEGLRLTREKISENNVLRERLQQRLERPWRGQHRRRQQSASAGERSARALRRGGDGLP